MYLSMVCGMFVCVSLSINVCMFTVSNALLMSNATAMVRVGGMSWFVHYIHIIHLEDGFNHPLIEHKN